MHTIQSTISQIVTSIKPFDQQEKEHIAFTQNWIASGSQLFRLFKPANPAIHLVSYFVVFDQNSQKILMVDHKKSELWLPPGGHVERNEHPKETVKREIIEELGIEAHFFFDDPFFLTVTDTVGCVQLHTDVSLWYVVKGNSNESLQYDKDEFHQICWYDWDQIPYERSDVHMRRFIDKLMHHLANKI
ncbi:NUDIX hydrolase [Parachlamydia acanthamoebae]|uniref:Nudix hydrolase domain-containing protein n=2 Tax=Parachlamydia acanthamoebae TaxID=83552 RepID=F8L1C2_PARAV|nr:NUDIX hydrolase [Parachlamydia acanthamoebae]CCB87056.1 putative uncharacterized protein [Parachlamydia acanthamoebae UV-7]